MRLIPARYVDGWDKKIDTIVNGSSPLTDDNNSNPDFPWNQAWECTTQYIVSKKERAVPGLSDERLIKLIQKSETKDVALAACSHLLSPQAVRTLIVRDFVRLDFVTHLKLICISHHISPTAVDEVEAERAKALLVAYQNQKPGVDGQYLKNLFDIINGGVPKTSLVYATLHTAIISAIPKVTAELVVLRQNCQWHRAWKMIKWISAIPSSADHIPADCINPVELLDRNFRPWRMWAAWEPSESKSSEYRASDIQRISLREYLALEGPDDQPNPKTNVCERVMAQGIEIESSIARIKSIRLQLEEGTQDEAREMLSRLFGCTGRAFRVGSSNVELLILLFLGNVITADALDVLDAVTAATDIKVTYQVCMLYKSIRDEKHDKIQNAKIALPLLHARGCEKLKASAFGSLVVEIIMEDIIDIQEELLAGWEANTSTDKQAGLNLISAVTELRDGAADLPWLSSIVGEPFIELVKNWPSSDELTNLLNMRSSVRGVGGLSADRLASRIVGYLKDLLIRRGSIDQDTRNMVQALMVFWRKSPDMERQRLAILLADGTGKFRIDCILQMDSLSHNNVLKLNSILADWAGIENFQDTACETLAKFLASDEPRNEVVSVWKPVLYRMLKKRGLDLIDNALQLWPVERYISLLGDIRKVFGDKFVWNPKLSPAILAPTLHQWADRLAAHIPVLLRLEAAKDTRPALQCILAGNDPWILEGILCHLELEDCWVDKTAMYEASYGITCLLSQESGNAQDIYDVLCSVFQMTLDGAAACIRLLELCKSGQKDAASVLLPGWLQDSSWSEYDYMGFRDTARLLQIGSSGSTDVSTKTLEGLADYMDACYAELLTEAQRLDFMRVALKARDCEAVSQLLYDNMIEDTTSMEDSFARLPIELLNVVEKVNDSEVEILFPLNDITPLQRAAMGIGNAQSLLIRLFIGDYGSQPKFCIHLDNEPKIDSHDVHSQWVVFQNTRAPELPICHGKVTPATYQLARVLSRYLVGGFKDLLSIHTLISKSLKAMGSECIICGTLHGAALRRATICDGWECNHIFSRSPIEIRLADIRQDPMAVDMLLTMIQSAITAGHHNLLPNCPFDKATCLAILRTLPSMEELRTSKYLWVTIRNDHDGKSEQFLTWAICSFRGFLSTATGNLRIPSLPPGTLQFVLANAAPLKEITFASEFTTNAQQSRVMFHGTSLDRLYLIMHQGLKVMSGTPLQAYGAASGPGIYLAEEPSTSWAYADRKAAAKANWKNSAIKNGRVLLGCELTAPLSVGRNGVHVVQKEGSVMVRYIFVVPTATVTMPISGHVSPALMSVYNSLRSGAL